jgi:hypothetical protein
MGIVETSTNSGKEPRGIRGISFVGSNTTFSSWKIQGNLVITSLVFLEGVNSTIIGWEHE